MATQVKFIEGIHLFNTYNHTLTFPSYESQLSFFESHESNLLLDATYHYLRRENKINVNATIDDLSNINYLMLNNDNTKWMFYFIIDKKYVNDEVTSLEIELDVMQTYMFDFSLKETFIEREHQDRMLNNEGNLIPIYSKTQENIDYGKNYERILSEIIYDKNTPSYSSGKKVNIVWYYVFTTAFIDNGDHSDNLIFGTSQAGIETGTYLYVFPRLIIESEQLNPPKLYDSTGNHELGVNLKYLSEHPSVKSIQISRYAPYNVFYNQLNDGYKVTKSTTPDYINLVTIVDGSRSYYCYLITHLKLEIKELYEDSYPNLTLPSINDNVDIKYETKLYTNPYCFNKVKMGDNELILLNENADSLIKIGYVKSLNNKSTAMVIPINYEKSNYNYERTQYNVSENELPLINDAWKQYEIANKASLRSGLLVKTDMLLAGAVLGAATGGIGLAAAGAATIGFGGQIANQLIQHQNIKQTPDDLKSSGDDLGIKYVKDKLYLIYEKYEIESSYKQRLFNYFKHYGYKCNDFKVPNLKTRYYYNYIKTIGCNIDSNIDNKYITRIREIFDKGITLWHYRDDTTFKGIENYDYENVEMSLIE